MQTICLPKKQINLREFVQRRAAESDCPEILREEFKLIDEETGRVIALYCKPNDENERFKELFDACMSIKYSTTHRTSGLKTTSRIFGFNPRNAIRKDFCSIASLATEQPKQNQTILNGGALAAKYYAIHNPELYDAHLATTKTKIVDEFQLPNVPFTSGIINDNNPLCYHFDAGNFKGVWSAMIVLKHKIGGGFLSMPEYGVACEVAHNSIFYFDGQSILHGVTPIQKLAEDSRRFSIVYYSLRAMWDCQPLRDEIARARMRREAVEQRRLRGEKVKS